MTDIIGEYFNALRRLENGHPINVPKGTKITKDAVSLEAGRRKGSIKRTRPFFLDLIMAISEAADKQDTPNVDFKKVHKKAKNKADEYQRLYEAGCAREVSLRAKIDELGADIRNLKSKLVIQLVQDK